MRIEKEPLALPLSSKKKQHINAYLDDVFLLVLFIPCE